MPLYVKHFFTDICNDVRAVELYAESVYVATLYSSPDEFPSLEAVLCTRLAEFNFLIDKLKISKLQCTRNETNKVYLGLLASSDMTQGNYYLATYGEIAYGLGDDGVLPYINGTAINEQIGFQ